MPRSCPCADELRRWLENGQDTPALETHVESCPDCQRAVENLLNDSALGLTPVSATMQMGPAASFLKRLEEIAPLDGASADESNADSTVVQHFARSGAESHPPAGYEIEGELGKGGMGVVWRGHDLHLRREVAIKVMKREFVGQPQFLRRFNEEARLTSQLQHPAIPPVHELGELPDGRPYFVMKLVNGRTLAALLKARKNTADDLPRFLGIFEQVCQALAYAHSKGVIHRDLKPANIMVGAFGEVQVMDWGLAKVLQEDGPRAKAQGEGSRVPPAACGFALEAHARTEAGSVLGTYAYMPPEQARGDVDRLDRRCDVFGLGAILCEVLTGAPPYVGTDREVKPQAQMGDLAAARERLAASGADEELVELATRCLSARAEDRPADGAAVAKALTAYLTGVQERLHKAELERAAAEARSTEAKATAAAERKARGRTRAFAVAMLALVAACAGAALLVQHQVARRQAERLRRDVEKRQTAELALAKALELREQTRWREAETILDQAHQLLGEDGPGDLRQQLFESKAKLDLVKKLDAIRQRRATLIEGKLDTRTTARDYASAFQEAGLGAVGDDGESVAKQIRSSGVSGPLVAALDDWAGVAPNLRERSWVLHVARIADPDSWANRFRDPRVWRDQRQLEALAKEALHDDGSRLEELSPQLIASVETLLLQSPMAVPLLRAAQRRHRGDFWLSLYLANALYSARQFDDAATYFLVAIALRPDSAVAYNNLGNVLADKKDSSGAGAEYRKAIELDPRYASPHYNLANLLRTKKDLDGAIVEYRIAIDLDPTDAKFHYNLGNVLRAKKDLDGAVGAYHKAIDADPNDPLGYYNLGLAMRSQMKFAEAIAAYRKTIELAPSLVQAHINLGNALLDHNEPDAAIAAYRKAIQINPKIALAHYNLGNVLLQQGQFGEARKAALRVLELHAQSGSLRRLAQKQLKKCDILIAQDEKLSSVLNGQWQPASATEHLLLGQLCGRYKRQHAAAARRSAVGGRGKRMAPAVAGRRHAAGEDRAKEIGDRPPRRPRQQSRRSTT